MTMKKEKKEGEGRGCRTSVNICGPTISPGNKISETRLWFCFVCFFFFPLFVFVRL
jgi:hypothetical protein